MSREAQLRSLSSALRHIFRRGRTTPSEAVMLRDLAKFCSSKASAAARRLGEKDIARGDLKALMGVSHDVHTDKALIRMAQTKFHPDVGGDSEQFNKAQGLIEVLRKSE